jgi:hypothetical protein
VNVCFPPSGFITKPDGTSKTVIENFIGQEREIKLQNLNCPAKIANLPINPIVTSMAEAGLPCSLRYQ